MSMPDVIWLNREVGTAYYWDAMNHPETAEEYICRSLLDAELKECCELVIAMGLSTGHAESHVELIKEVLNQVRNMRKL